MPEWLIIVLICVGAIVAIWLLIILLISIALIVCNNHINRNRMGINIILAQKHDVSNVLAKHLLEQGVVLPDEIRKEFNLSDKPNFESFTTFERKSIGFRIDEVIESLIKIANENHIEDQRFITLQNSIEDINKQHRRAIATYNNRVWFYNYWIKFIPYRLISKLFKIKPRKTME